MTPYEISYSRFLARRAVLANPRPVTASSAVWSDDLGAMATRMTTQLLCNGCDRPLGDATVADIEAFVYGPPIDYRIECPACWPEAPVAVPA